MITDQMRDINHAVIGAFLCEGLHDVGYDEVLAAWDQGCLELQYEVCRYAPYIETKVQEHQDFPGVFDYEVTVPFGQWFGQQVIAERGSAPTSVACKAMIDQLCAEFFAEGACNG